MHALDLTDDASVTTFAEKVAADLGDIEVVISNAGSVGPGTTHEVETHRFARELDLNIVGAHRLVRAFVPGMVEGQRRPGLAPPTSPCGPAPVHVPYAAGKWGLEGLAHAMQMELEGTGVRRPIVRPGPTWSEMGSTGRRPAAFVLDQWVRSGTPGTRILKPAAIADAITTVVRCPAACT